MPKLIDYPRTSYAGAWELSEVVDDTGGKCAIDTAARKLNRKVSGSFKAIIGSAVKFGLMTSKRDLLTTTTLFKRIKHAYDKQEELLFHREAFLTPPLFTQLCRKFRSRELPVQMLDVMLLREFGVEEINAQGVAKAFVDGCRMVGLLDENNIIADIDALSAQRPHRRELASPPPAPNSFRTENQPQPDGQMPKGSSAQALHQPTAIAEPGDIFSPGIIPSTSLAPATAPLSRNSGNDAIASLFGLLEHAPAPPPAPQPAPTEYPAPLAPTEEHRVDTAPMPAASASPVTPFQLLSPEDAALSGYQIRITGPGVNTALSITEEEDIVLAIALLEKIRRQLKS